jgi:hypothetical protein
MRSTTASAGRPHQGLHGRAIALGMLVVAGCWLVADTPSLAAPALANPSTVVTAFTSAGDFLAATTTTMQATYESFSEGIHPDPVIDGAVIATRGPGGDPLYVGHPGGPGDGSTYPHLHSAGLMANGNEVIDLTFSSGPHGAIGFDTITNSYAPPTVTVFGLQDVVLASFVLTQAPNTYGFFGVVSDVPIGRVRWAAVGGGAENTVLDNVLLGEMLPVAIDAANWSAVKSLFR